MERVLGIGGFFFTANDPDRLSSWYSEHLGVEPPPQSYDHPVWTQDAGPTVFAPFSGQEGQSPVGAAGWGLNFRVADLDSMVRQLRSAGIEVEVDGVVYPNGRFGQLIDPEGNAIQLWELA
jgi:predicted enzyme related to lactoylglutathione lyase